MLHNWSGRLMVPLMLIAATVALIAPASAGVVPGFDWTTYEWYSGASANDVMDVDVRMRVYQLESSGNPHGISGSYAGMYLYEYELYVDDDDDVPGYPSGSNANAEVRIEWFQVQWTSSSDPVVFGHTDGPGYTWAWYGNSNKCPGNGGNPTSPGEWLTWRWSRNPNEEADAYGEHLGTFWAVAQNPPTVKTGLVANSHPNAEGPCFVPTPEVPTLLLLMTSGVPAVGLGYLRRRRIA